jgi:signal transduction histidine kinase
MLPEKLSERLHVLQRLLPIAVMVIAALYQFGPARFIHDRYGDWAHYGLEVLFYGTVGPIFLWVTFRVVRVWVEQKEQAEAEVYRLNSELQQRVEERTSELKQKADALEAANLQLQKLDQIKSEFVSLVSHEFRAPLTNVRGALELMGDSCITASSTCNRMLRIVNAEVDRLGRLVEDVLNVSRIEAGELKFTCVEVDVVQVIYQVVDEFMAHHVSRKIQPRIGAVSYVLWADVDRLHQVIANLIDNAVKYSPENSEVTVSIESNGAEGVLSVSDHGPGIPIMEQSHLFQKFYRLDSRDDRVTYGYGLGLYLSRRLIEAMNGRIWVESTPGHGATFRFALPLAKKRILQDV